MSGMPPAYNGALYEMDKAGTIISIGRPLRQGKFFDTTLFVNRRSDWGWELHSNAYVARSIAQDDNVGKDRAGEWRDYTSKLIIEERASNTKVIRLRDNYNYREIPDVLYLKVFLLW